MIDTEFMQELARDMIDSMEEEPRQWIFQGTYAPICECDPHHHWNCEATPIWAQTIRELDTNPWTVVSTWMKTP